MDARWVSWVGVMGKPRSARLVFAAVAALAVLAGCAHGGAIGTSDAIEAACFREAHKQKPACPEGDAACCAERAAEAHVAAGAGDTVRSARLWHAVALACPARRDEAASAALALATAPPAQATARMLNVSYKIRLSPAYRLYWVAAAVGPRLLPSAGGPATSEAIQVEVQAMRFDRGRPGPLVLVERSFALPPDPGATVTIVIAEGGAAATTPLALSAEVERPPPVDRARPPAATRKVGRTPILDKARPLHVAPARTPLEFGQPMREARPVVRLCLDREGALDTLRFLELAHPRLAATVIDSYRDSRHEPYRVDDLAVPSCEVARPS